MRIISPSYEILTPISEGGISELSHIERIGRVCYKSEDRITDDGESAKKFISMLIDKGHCYDELTEILTLKGWKKYNELTEDDLYATLNKDGIVEYLPKNGYTQYEYIGDMVSVKSQLVDLLVTDEHNMYVCTTTTSQGRKKNNFRLIKAKELINTSHVYVKNSNGIIFRGSNIPLNIIKLLGFAIGDGNVHKNNLTFHLKKERKINYLTNLLNNESIQYSVSNEKDGSVLYRIGLSTDNVLSTYINIFKGIYNNKKEKVIPLELIKTMNKQECKALLSGLLESDGSYSIMNNKYHSKYFCTTSKILSDQFQQLALHCGYSSNLGSIQSSGFGSSKPVYRMSLITRYNKPEINKCAQSKGFMKLVHNQKRVVWCINISPYHNVYVRRNGKPVWCGNCAMIEHSSLSVKFIVDRGVSHELVRHRIASFAQESSRYCNYSKDKFGNEITVIKPCFWKEDSENFKEWKMACENAESTYFYLLSNGASAQEARSVLPNSLKTEIIMTANYREWRAFFKLRTEQAAHPSMREITIPLLKELQQRIPIIFDDIEVK